MKKWALAAVLYLLLVMGGYAVYDAVFADENVNTEEHGGDHEE
ncbi:MAG TPA: hypothetical protein VNM69_08895 [Bacillus sp. (in: firmicutes)]|nr:hypothetical protein [Bacillus litorisediminis]HWO75998.1 hypothetical protein [Bacillus sp. (in: firmicutes)]